MGACEWTRHFVCRMTNTPTTVILNIDAGFVCRFWSPWHENNTITTTGMRAHSMRENWRPKCVCVRSESFGHRHLCSVATRSNFDIIEKSLCRTLSFSLFLFVCVVSDGKFEPLSDNDDRRLENLCVPLCVECVAVAATTQHLFAINTIVLLARTRDDQGDMAPAASAIIWRPPTMPKLTGTRRCRCRCPLTIRSCVLLFICVMFKCSLFIYYST